MKRILLIISFFLVGCSQKKPTNEVTMPPVPVQTAEVATRDVPFYFEEMGRITACQSALIRPEVDGCITGVHFREGDFVTKGDLLYTIDDQIYRIKVQEAEALLSQNLAHLKNATKKLERYKNLSKQNLISEIEWDELETKILLYQAEVQGNEAKLAGVKLDLQQCSIRAPISGRTGKSALGEGNIVSKKELLLTISGEKPFYVDFSITQKEIEQISSIAPSFEVYAAGGEECLGKGTLTFLDHTIDPKSGMLFARGLLDAMYKPLWAGQMVRVHLFFGKKDQAKLIPLKAIKTNQSGPYVFSIKEDNTVEMCPVILGPEEKGMIVIEEGLDHAKRVVTEGHLRLFPGSKIEALSP